MESPVFVDDENIPLVTHHGKNVDYDNYNTPKASRLDETTFTTRSSKDKLSTLWLRQKVEQDKLPALYRHLSVTGHPDLADICPFGLNKTKRQEMLIYFFDGKNWQSLTTKRTGELFSSIYTEE